MDKLIERMTSEESRHFYHVMARYYEGKATRKDVVKMLAEFNSKYPDLCIMVLFSREKCNINVERRIGCDRIIED